MRLKLPLLRFDAAMEAAYLKDRARQRSDMFRGAIAASLLLVLLFAGWDYQLAPDLFQQNLMWRLLLALGPAAVLLLSYSARLRPHMSIIVCGATWYCTAMLTVLLQHLPNGHVIGMAGYANFYMWMLTGVIALTYRGMQIAMAGYVLIPLSMLLWWHAPADAIINFTWQSLSLYAFVSYLALILDYGRRKTFVLRRRLEQLAMMDSLTGLFNRREFLLRCQHELERHRRYRHTLTFLMLDIDFFKPINDQYGHLGGDEVLRQISDVIRASIRDADIVGRLGGEEFALLLPETQLADGMALAERLREAIAGKPMSSGLHTLNVTVSIGAASYRHGDDLSRLLRTADEGMYLAKHNGRNRVCTVETADSSSDLSDWAQMFDQSALTTRNKEATR